MNLAKGKCVKESKRKVTEGTYHSPVITNSQSSTHLTEITFNLVPVLYVSFDSKSEI